VYAEHRSRNKNSTVTWTGKKNGEVILTTKNAISEDGRTETTVWSGLDEKGQPQGWTIVFEKQ